MKSRKIEAFVTIEYSILLPMILLVATFLVCIGMYLYNQCIFQTNLYILAIEGARIESNKEKDIIQYLCNKEKDLYKNKYILMEKEETLYKIKGNRLVITAKGEMSNILQSFNIGNETWKLYAESEAWLYKPGELLRIMKETSDLLGESVFEKEESDV
jgi:hypothetical protein